MVNVSDKADTRRTAVAAGAVAMAPETLEMIAAGRMKKGDVLGLAQVAGIMGAKKTWELIPMCHNIPITGADIRFELDRERSEIRIEAELTSTGKTGIEMEALTAVATAALAMYDMAKAVDRGMEIRDIRLIRKEGGKSGVWVRDDHRNGN
jgi:cyclic pyranopterin phosphate synthase